MTDPVLLSVEGLQTHFGMIDGVVRADNCRSREYMHFDTVLQRDVAHPSHGLVVVDLTADFGWEGCKIYPLLPRLQ